MTRRRRPYVMPQVPRCELPDLESHSYYEYVSARASCKMMLLSLLTYQEVEQIQILAEKAQITSTTTQELPK